MDLQALKDEALSYCTTSKNGLQLSEIIGEKLYFSCKASHLMFYIYPPASASESWSIWSDASAHHETLGTIMDSFDLESCKNITEILKNVDKFLSKTKKLNIPDKKKHKASRADKDDDSGSRDDEDDEDDLENYYVEEDFDALADQTKYSSAESYSAEEGAVSLPSLQASAANSFTVKRLLKDLKVIKLESSKFGIVGGPVDDNIFLWNVKFKDIPADTELARSLKYYAQRYKEEEAIFLELKFPQDFPYSPPFVRVVKPRLKLHTGHVTAGGSICMEALTKSGWSPSNSIESILVQIRSVILSDPNTTLRFFFPAKPYLYEDALQSYKFMLAKHQWK